MDASSTRHRAGESDRGRQATAPHEIPARGWKDILWRTWAEFNEDRVTLIAAGATFFLLLSLVPTLTAVVSLYGLFNDPATVQGQVAQLAGIVPAGGLELIDQQLTRLTRQGPATLGWGLAISLGIALWSASTGVKNMFEAMNIAFDERESRNFFVLNGMALLFTLGGVVGAAIMVSVVVVLPLVLNVLGINFGWLVQALGYVLLLAVLLAGVSLLYRYGPSRQRAKWRWLTPGAVLAVAIILVASLLFSWYSANFANYEKTYGSLGGLIGFLTWMWISVTMVIAGAELDAEMEHQTARDSTVGADAPMGDRQAVMADTIGKSTDEAGPAVEDFSDRSDEWRAGYEAASQRQRGRQRPLTLGSLAFALPAALALSVLQRRRRDSRG